MGNHVSDTFEVDVSLELCPAPVRLKVECTFLLDSEGPAHIRFQAIDLLTEVNHQLVFTTEEVMQIRFALADAIERKYWAGEYRGSTDDTNVRHLA